MRPVEILDCTLRDGSYVIDFQFTAEDTALLVSTLDSAGIRLIEVGHGMGLGAARAGHGEQPCSDRDYLRVAANASPAASVGAFFIPGIGTTDDLRLAAGEGAGFVRIGTNITELASAEPFIAEAKRLGLQVFANLMKSYAVPAAEWGECARQAAEFGADVVCLVDSAGAMLPKDVAAYLWKACGRTDVRLAFHGHDNLCLATANALAAVERGACVVDASLQGLGRSEGNAATEVLAAVLEKRGLLEGVDVNGLLDISEAFVRPLLRQGGRSGVGVTAGRARFHSSFLGRAMQAASQHGVDARDVILGLSERNIIDPSDDLMRQVAAEIAATGPRQRVRVDVPAGDAAKENSLAAQARRRAEELREKARKQGLPAVMNVVVTPYEATAVSPYVETRYGCALANIMLAEAALLPGALEAVDGVADYVLLDVGPAAVDDTALARSTLLVYSDHAMWAAAAVSQVVALLCGDAHGKRVAVTGVPPLAVRVAALMLEHGATLLLDETLVPGADALRAFAAYAPERLRVAWLADAARDADAVMSLSPRKPAVDAPVAQTMRADTLLFDGGIGSVSEDAVAAAEQRGVRVVRVDMRPTLAATALERIAMKGLVEQHMGRDTWDGVSVVAGGLIGRKGEVIVDSIAAPTRVIGIADGRGGIASPEPGDPAVLRVRRSIAERRLGGTTGSSS